MTKATEVAVGLDIASLDTVEASDKGARIELKHPTTGDPLGVFITVLGKHSHTFRDIVRDRINKRVREEANAARRGKPATLKTAEVQEAEGVELLAACTTGWDTESKVEGEPGKVTSSPTMTFRGEQLPFNMANAIRVYSEILWVREQVDAAIGDLENFIVA